jgi:predicted transcriptional regulator
MAMTLRLDPAHEQLLTQLSEQQQRSKNEIVALAIEEFAARTEKRDRTRAAFARVLERDAGLLDALSK